MVNYMLSVPSSSLGGAITYETGSNIWKIDAMDTSQGMPASHKPYHVGNIKPGPCERIGMGLDVLMWLRHAGGTSRCGIYSTNPVRDLDLPVGAGLHGKCRPQGDDV